MEGLRGHFKRVREYVGLTQEELSLRSGVCLSSYQKWESGKSDLYVSSLEKLVLALDCDIVLIGSYMGYKLEYFKH